MSSHILNQEMSMDSIVPSKDNARNINVLSVSFLDLKESIKAGGVQVPIHVWPHPDKRKKNIFEIRCGERRWRACKILKHKTIPAIVHRGISYEVAMLLTITENKFHVPLKPLEEVEEISRCMDNLDGDAKLIAGLIGQTEQWVRMRANIHRNLGQEWRQSFSNLDWSIGHLTLIARLPAGAQAELLKGIIKKPWQWENVSVQDLNHRISEALMLLNKADWNLNDELLVPKAGACTDCKKRSGAEPVLWFGPLENQIDTKDRCLDPLCWNNKMLIHLQHRAKYFSDKHSNLAFCATEHLSESEKEILTKKFGRVYDPNDYQKSTKGSKNAIPALVVSGKGAGSIMFVREKKFAELGIGGPKRAGKVTPLKERRAQLDGRRWAQVLLLICEKVDAAPLKSLTCKDKTTAVMALAAIFGNQTGYSVMEGRKMFESLVNTADKGGREKALELLWVSVKPTLISMISYGGPASQIGKYYIKTTRWVGKLLGLDVPKIFTEVTKTKGFTVPKSWAGLNEDGTQKKSKAKKAKPKTKTAKAAKKAEPAKAVKKPKIVRKTDKTVKVDFRPKKKK